MKVKTESTSRNFARSLSMGVLLSMFFFYGIHVFGSWEVENYRPDPETTSTILLHNKCLFSGREHTLRPNTDVSNMSNGINGTKLAGSFMNFWDGHIVGMVFLGLLLGGGIFVLRSTIKKKRQTAFVQ